MKRTAFGFGGVFIVIWAVMFFGILGLFCLAVVSNVAMYIGADTVRVHAEDEARIWVSNMYPTVADPRISCQALDTDNNGYVTCTANLDGEHVNIECYAWLFVNPGGSDCREIMPVRVYTAPR